MFTLPENTVCQSQMTECASVYIISHFFCLDAKKEPLSPHEMDDFFVFPKHLELLGDDAKDCGVSVSLEWTAMETEARNDVEVSYVLYRYNKHLWQY